MAIDKHISSVVKICFLQPNELSHIEVSSLNLLLLHLQMPLCIPALIIVIALYMVFQSILCHRLQKVQNSVARNVTYTSRSSHITPFQNSLY